MIIETLHVLDDKGNVVKTIETVMSKDADAVIAGFVENQEKLSNYLDIVTGYTMVKQSDYRKNHVTMNRTDKYKYDPELLEAILEMLTYLDNEKEIGSGVTIYSELHSCLSIYTHFTLIAGYGNDKYNVVPLTNGIRIVKLRNNRTDKFLVTVTYNEEILKVYRFKSLKKAETFTEKYNLISENLTDLTGNDTLGVATTERGF